MDKEAEKFLLEAANGDARVMLNVLEIAASLVKTPTIKIPDLETALQRRQYTFDKRGEDFYNVISAFIKSMRASDVDSALYYLARMVAAGQDPFILPAGWLCLHQKMLRLQRHSLLPTRCLRPATKSAIPNVRKIWRQE